jgi:hypothetical protein
MMFVFHGLSVTHSGKVNLFGRFARKDTLLEHTQPQGGYYSFTMVWGGVKATQRWCLNDPLLCLFYAVKNATTFFTDD